MLKNNAKAALRNFYWNAVVVSVLVLLLGGSLGVQRANFSFNFSMPDVSDIMDEYYHDDDYYDDDDYDDYYNDDYRDDYHDYHYHYYDDDDYYDYSYDDNSDAEMFENVVAMLKTVTIIIFIAAVLFSVFVGSVVTVGQYRFYLNSRSGTGKIGDIFSNFKNGAYVKTFLGILIMNLKIVLWYMLFIIPGIIKTYEYFLVPYILADNPHIDRSRAFELSKRAMDGEKLNCWVLQLSFIGWNILASIVPFGRLFLAPYYNATMAEFYSCMKQKLLVNNVAYPDDFGNGTGFFAWSDTGSVYTSGTNTGYMSGTPQGGVSSGYNGSSNGYNSVYGTGNNSADGYGNSYNSQNDNGDRYNRGMQSYRPISGDFMESTQGSYDPNGQGKVDLSKTDREKTEFGEGIGDDEDDYKGPEL